MPDSGLPVQVRSVHLRAGEPMGRPWATPRIQLAALVEDQVENTWGALVPMIDDGPLSVWIPKTGEAFIRHPSGNRDSRIEIVTSKADSKLGARISAGKCDETGLWNAQNKMDAFERNLRRGAGGIGGRISHSSNPYDPLRTRFCSSRWSRNFLTSSSITSRRRRARFQEEA